MGATSLTWLVTGFPAWTARALVRELIHSEEPARVLVLVPADQAAHAEVFLNELRPPGSTVRIVEGDTVRMDLGLPGRDYMALTREVDVVANLYDVSPLPDDETGSYGGLYGRLGDPAQLTAKAVEEVLEFATTAGSRLRHVVHLGSLTVAGDYTGVWTEEEDVPGGQRHRNEAERWRRRAEQMLWRVRDRVPFTIFRVGPLLGDSRTGEIGWYHGPYDLPEAMLLLPSTTGWGIHPPDAVNAVPVDHLARMMRAVGTRPPERSGALHVVPAERLPLARLRQALASGSEPPPRLPPPVRRRLRKRWGGSAAAVARSLWRIDTRATCCSRRALEVMRAAGITEPRPADYLPKLASHMRARLLAESRRLLETGVEDSLDV